MPTITPVDRNLQNRRVWLAPVCLCLVAALHLWRVTSAGQTPWKGGGFGMFSTIDTEHARYVRAWLVTKAGERPISVPPDLEKKVAELRAAPNQAGLDDLAQKLTERAWFDPRDSQRLVAEQLWPEGHSIPLTAARWQALRKEATQPLKADQRLPQGSVHAFNLHDPTQQGIVHSAIRVEVWKYEMPAGTARLQGQRLFTTTANQGDHP